MSTLRSRTIRLAYANPDLRPHLLPLLTGRTAMEHSSPEALKKYLKEHPDADPKNHTVQKSEKDKGGKEDGGKALEVFKGHPDIKKVEEKLESYKGDISARKKGAEKALSGAQELEKESRSVLDDEDAYVGDKMKAARSIAVKYKQALVEMDGMDDISGKAETYASRANLMDAGKAVMKSLGEEAGLKAMRGYRSNQKEALGEMERDIKEYKGKHYEKVKSSYEKYKKMADQYASEGDLGDLNW